MKQQNYQDQEVQEESGKAKAKKEEKQTPVIIRREVIHSDFEEKEEKKETKPTNRNDVGFVERNKNKDYNIVYRKQPVKPMTVSELFGIKSPKKEEVKEEQEVEKQEEPKKEEKQEVEIKETDKTMHKPLRTIIIEIIDNKIDKEITKIVITANMTEIMEIAQITIKAETIKIVIRTNMIETIVKMEIIKTVHIITKEMVKDNHLTETEDHQIIKVLTVILKI